LPLRASILDGGEDRMPARRGELFHYRVRLTNEASRSFRFGRCPAYVQNVGAGPSRVYLLNCRAMGTLAPKASAVFDMRVLIPAHEPELSGIFWELAPLLDGPDADAGLEVR
jgi:hypothetical protein